MAALTPVAPARVPAELEAIAAAAEGDEFANTGKELLLIENGAGSPVTLTIETIVTVDGEAVADKDVIIPAGERHIIGPFPTTYYNDGDDLVQLTYTSETDVTVAVIKPS